MKVLKKLFSGTTEPKPGAVYAITGGTYLGDFLVYIEQIGGDLMFLSLPKMEAKIIPYDKYMIGIKDEVLEKVEELPQDIYSVCVTQYRKSKEQS